MDVVPSLYCGVGLGLLVQMKEFALGGYKSLEAIPFWRSPTSPVGRLNGVMHRWGVTGGGVFRGWAEGRVYVNMMQWLLAACCLCWPCCCGCAAGGVQNSMLCAACYVTHVYLLLLSLLLSLLMTRLPAYAKDAYQVLKRKGYSDLSIVGGALLIPVVIGALCILVMDIVVTRHQQHAHYD
jgi:hypothetical protein